MSTKSVINKSEDVLYSILMSPTSSERQTDREASAVTNTSPVCWTLEQCNTV